MAKYDEEAVEESMDIEEYVPSIQISESQLPAIKKWNVDSTYTVTMKLKMTGIYSSDWGKNKGKHEATFKIQSVEDAS